MSQDAAPRAPGQTSTLGTFISLVLCFFGLGLLTMPYGMQFVGMIGGPIIIIMVCLITYYSFYVLIETKRFLNAKGRDVLSYGDIGRGAYGNKGGILVNIAIIANQTGVLAAYQQFMGTAFCLTLLTNYLNLLVAKNALHFTLLPVMPLWAWTFVCLVVLIPLCWVRELKYFSFTSALGLITVAFTVGAVLYNGFQYPTPPDPLPIGPSDLFLFLGIGAFAYAAIAVSINLENNMRQPQHFLKSVAGTFAIISTVYIGFGLGVYYLYGDNVQAVISCVVAGPLGLAVKAGLVAQLTFALPFNADPIWVTCEPMFKRKLASRFGPRAIFWILNLWRALYLTMTGVLAFSVPYFGDFSNLVGAIATSFLTWVLPPFFHLVTVKGISYTLYLGDVAVIAFGFCVMISSSAVTIISLIGSIESTAPPNLHIC